MAKVEIYKCDECGVTKQDSNHWFLAVIDYYFAVYGWEVSPLKRYITNNSVTEHICGQSCLVKRFSKWVEERGKLCQQSNIVDSVEQN